MEQIKTLEERENSLIEKGKVKGFITYEELAFELKGLDIDNDALDNLYNKLEASAQKKEFRSYEEKNPEIKRCIEVYKEKFQEEPAEQINQKVSFFCF